MAFSNDELLSWFCATNPLPVAADSNIEMLPPPGHTRYTYKPPPPQPPAPLAERMRRFDDPTSPSAAGGGSYYKKLIEWQQAMENYGEPPLYNFYGVEEDVGEYFPGKESNPNAQAGDDDHLVTTTVYDPDMFKTNNNPDLPIAMHRDRVIQTIEANSVTVIQGSTGSGKSTQVPQYILEHYAMQAKHCNIICTQPRRIAATSIAKFVASSREWPLGQLVGYQIGLDKNLSDNTRLTFATTGVLKQKLIGMKNMNQYTHVILDEVHERDQDTDFCLLLVRKLLRTNSKHVKVVLMSATFESDVFAQYFAMRISGRLEPAPIVNVEGKPFPVTEFYLDDIKHIGECQQMNVENPRVTEEAMILACKLIDHFDEIERHDPEYRSERFFPGTVLVFLPGLPEIHEMDEKMVDACKRRLLKLPLHSTITGEEQGRVFLKPERGRRKVILATNIAESSITVPDIKYVIDFCLVKQIQCDLQTNCECLRLCWASKASLKQRKGRAGRVSAGRCYRLITRGFFRSCTPEYSTPEMQRCSLEKVVLHAKQLDLGEPRAILGLALQPPNLAGIEKAILTLKELGALSVLCRGVVNPYDGDLTFVGRVLASLPVDVRIGKLLILGHAFGCLEECLVIGAALSQIKSFFTKPYKMEMMAYRSKMEWSRSSFSDCIAILNAYKDWFSKKDSGSFRSSGLAEKSWCQRNLIHKPTINAVAEVIREISFRLARFNIKPLRKLVSSHHVEELHETLILKLVLCGAFYPNYFKWGRFDEEMNQREISGHDPTTTVVMSCLPPNPERYAGAICSMFMDDGNKGKYLHFEGNKVYVEFPRPRPSRSNPIAAVLPVLNEVYIALKKRTLRKPMILFGNDVADEIFASTLKRKEREVALSAGNREPNTDLKPLVLPKPKDFCQIIVTEMVDAGHFWAQFADTETVNELQKLMDATEHHKPVPLLRSHEPKALLGCFCLAMYSDDNRYYRAKIEAIDNHAAQVVFVDYGNVEWVPFDFICELPMEEPFRNMRMQALECFLSGVKPSYSHCSEGRWTTEALLRFRDLTYDKHLIAKVYSSVNGVLRVELFDTTGKDDILINEVLVREGFAEQCDETFQSKFAHEQKPSPQQEMEAMKRGVNLSRPNNISVEWTSEERFEDKLQRSGKYSHLGGLTSKYILRGPNNPYEVSFYAMTTVGSMRPARIQQDSVNSIVVDNEPQDKHDRMMVAAYVSLNPSGSTCVARETTLLPNIHGLPHIVCMLFSPSIEMRCDDLRRQYVGAICGLGFDPSSGQSIYPEHDIELTFDSLITQDDLKTINHVRLAINLAVGSSDENAVAEWGEQAIRRVQSKSRDLLRSLILKPRESVPPYESIRQGWNQVQHEHILLSESHDVDQESCPPLYPLHNGIMITGERIDQQRATRVLILREKMRLLHNKAIPRSLKPEVLICELCNVRCSNPRELYDHLCGRVHKAQEKRLFEDDLDLDRPEKELEKEREKELERERQ